MEELTNHAAPSDRSRQSARWAAVVLNWNGREETLRCLRSLRAAGGLDLPVVCVDNGSIDGSVDAIRKAFPEVDLIEAGANLGYAGGNNLGIRRALEAGADWVVLVNNDAMVAADLVEGFEAAVRRRPDAGILAGKVYRSDRPTTIWFAGQSVNLVLGYSGKPRGHNQPDGPRYGVVVDVGRAVGALMAVSRDTLQDVGLLDETLFAYVEDVEFCLRARKRGHAVVFAPGAHAWHSVSASTGGEQASTHSVYYGVRNTITVCERTRPLARPLDSLRRLCIVGTFAMYCLRRRHSGPALRALVAGYRDARHGRLGIRPSDGQVRPAARS